MHGKSLKGKARIKEHGNIWIILLSSDRVACLGNKPGWLLQAPSGYLRWMAKENDRDFQPSLGEHGTQS